MVLDAKLEKLVHSKHEELSAADELLSSAQLKQYHATFRARFGPEQLGALDGAALLYAMFDLSGRDCLAYWLEYKNDDEFPARFGSIAGGSALKYGLYRRKETGDWMTGSPQHQREITEREATEMCQRYRDELLAGAQLLEELPSGASDDVYASLQRDIDQVAPSLSNTAWAHKYSSLLFPDKLDDYHNPDYQRFHLIKMLQEPPPGEGRYRCAGRYVALAGVLGMSLNHLTKVLNELHRSPHRYWRIGTTLGGNESWWEVMRTGNCIAVGWDQLGDLVDIGLDVESKNRLRERMGKHYYPTNPATASKQANQLFSFVARIQEGDYVLPSKGRRVLGIGRVVGGYVYQPSSDMPHRRPVEWLSLEEWKLPATEGLRTTVHEIGEDVTNQMKHVVNLIAIERRVLHAPPLSLSTPSPGGPRPVRLTGTAGRIQAILERKLQVILYGPPGTGKTYWALRAAQDLAAGHVFGKAIAELDLEQQQAIMGADGQPAGLVRMCTFHPSYGYEDFIEGYRPRAVDGQLVFELRDGLFKRLCLDASRNPQQRYYLVIDEINRGDIPRIFGELITLLERDKRGLELALPLSGVSFRVPNNVYLIGTMNTADRSIALLDTALRRRFGFLELMPDMQLLRDVSLSGLPLAAWLKYLNDRILAHLGRDARNLQVGHAYLLDGGRPLDSLAAFARVLREDIIPLLEEYCYEDYGRLADILGRSVVDVSKQRIRSELFEDSRLDDLVQALNAPEIATSFEASSTPTGAHESGEDDSDAEPEDQ